MPHEHQQSADTHASGDDIPSGKAASFVPRMMPKAAYVKEADNDDSDFELVICGRKCGASRVSAGDN